MKACYSNTKDWMELCPWWILSPNIGNFCSEQKVIVQEENENQDQISETVVTIQVIYLLLPLHIGLWLKMQFMVLFPLKFPIYTENDNIN